MLKLDNAKVYPFSGALSAPKDLGCHNDFIILLDQLGVGNCARILGVHRTTIQRWAEGTIKVPRHVVLALYWESSWGRSLIDSEHMRALNLLYHEITSLKTTNKALLAALKEMERHIDGSAANSPVFDFETRHYATAHEPRTKPNGPPPQFPMKPKR